MRSSVFFCHISSDESLTRRQREKEAVASLLASAAPGVTVSHYDNGAPYVPDRPDVFISVSHSRTHAAIALSSVPVGIDIEQPRAQLLRVAPRFLSETEMKIFNTPALLLRAWTATEAVYKAAHATGDAVPPVELATDIRLSAPEDDTLVAELFGVKYSVEFGSVDDNVFAIAEPL